MNKDLQSKCPDPSEGTSKNMTDKEKDKNHLTNVLLKWHEEIFVDIYGCLVAGPAIVSEFQLLLSDNYMLTQNNGVHPIALVRPRVSTKTLDSILEISGYFSFS